MPLPDSIQSIDDLDWVELRSRAMAQKTRRRKSAADWDARADSFKSRSQHSDYIRQVIAQLPLTAATTVLDIGCGPGTLALPIARKCRQVTAIDFSSRMIELLNEEAAALGIDNITGTRLSWEDDWHAAGIEPHDITLASRSTAVEDLPAALTRLNDFARRAVFLTDRISPTPFEPEACAAAGIEFHPGPDYIYTVNILHSMGISADVRVLEFDRTREYENLDAAMRGFLWMFDQLDETQTNRLREYVRSLCTTAEDGTLTLTRKTPPRWALICWEKDDRRV